MGSGTAAASPTVLITNPLKFKPSLGKHRLNLSSVSSECSHPAREGFSTPGSAQAPWTNQNGSDPLFSMLGTTWSPVPPSGHWSHKTLESSPAGSKTRTVPWGPSLSCCPLSVPATQRTKIHRKIVKSLKSSPHPPDQGV